MRCRDGNCRQTKFYFSNDVPAVTGVGNCFFDYFVIV